MGGGSAKRGDYRDIAVGAGLQMAEAATLGMPFEVLKTRQGAYPQESVGQAFSNVWKNGGLRAFWRGTGAKQAESASKGAVLLYSKEFILDQCESFGMERKSAMAGVVGGAGGGVCQTVVMAPLTLVVTYKVKHPEAKDRSTISILREMGLARCYGSATPIALRQASNWALRQSLAGGVENVYRNARSIKGKLSAPEQMGCGIIGGALACVNQPFEVLRIMVQARHAKGDTAATTANTAQHIYRSYGLLGFYTGVIPRMGLSAWQTLFMVTFAGMVKDMIKEHDEKNAAK